MKKLVFINTHPIQYFAPLYKTINQEDFCDLEVWYCTKHGLEGEIDKQFGARVKWDIPLLEGYKYKFLDNSSFKPGIYNGFFGVINFGLWNELRKLPKQSYVIIHGWFPFSSSFAIILSNLFGHITCLRAESPLIHEKGRSKLNMILRKIIFKYFLFRFVDKYLYLGKQNRGFYEFYGVESSDLIFMPYSVDNDRFQGEMENLSSKKDQLRELFNIPKENTVILYSGKYIKKKNPMDLLKSINRLKDEKITCIFMGDGELRLEMENYITDHNLESVVVLTGFINQSEIVKYYAIADIFVMCSGKGETWGLSTNEAMNFGLPIVAYDMVGCSSDLVINGENGFIVSEGNKELLTEAIKNLIHDKDFRITAGVASKRIISNYSYRKIIENLKTQLLHI